MSRKSSKSSDSWGKRLQNSTNTFWQRITGRQNKKHDDSVCASSISDLSSTTWYEGYEPVPFPTKHQSSLRGRWSVQNDETTTEVEDDKYKVSRTQWKPHVL